MTTRDQIVHIALGFNGTCKQPGLQRPEPFSADLGRPEEAWCGDFVTDIYKRAQIPLPPTQDGFRTGFAYCPAAVRFGGPAHPTNPAKSVPARPRLLMLKSPMMTGADVRAVQQALNQRNHAGLAVGVIYNPATRDAVLDWQRREHIEVDGIVGPHTRSSLVLADMTSG
jgi:Putative peptidoglycan binding domain